MITIQRYKIPLDLACSMEMTLYQGERMDQGLLVYLHGGGFIFGHRDDLPQEYIQILTQAGYQLLTLDYLLAPETKLTGILAGLDQALTWFESQGYQILGMDHPDYYLFGRSAGAYLALVLASRRQARHLKGLISFYGYYSLQVANFTSPSHYYLGLAQVAEGVIQAQVQDQPLCHTSNPNRPLIYIYGRQTGKWLDSVLESRKDMDRYSLTEADLQKLVPLFITHARGDQDVPFHQSSRLYHMAPEAYFHPVDSQAHDFDRTEMSLHGLACYQALITWLKTHT